MVQLESGGASLYTRRMRWAMSSILPRLAELHLGGAILIAEAELDRPVVVEGTVVEAQVFLKCLRDKRLLVK